MILQMKDVRVGDEVTLEGNYTFTVYDIDAVDGLVALFSNADEGKSATFPPDREVEVKR